MIDDSVRIGLILICKDGSTITSGPGRRGMANAITLPRLIEEEKTFEIDFDSGSGCISEYFNNFISLWRLPLSSYTFDLIINNIFDHFASHNVQ